MRYLLPLLVLASSCTSLIDEPIYSIDTELIPYYEKFIAEGLQRGQDLSGRQYIIYFASHPDAVGIAHHRTDNIVEITIDREHWDSFAQCLGKTDEYREIIMFHEFGHAFFHKEHSSDPFSFMHKDQLVLRKSFEIDRLKMVDKLFSN